MSLELEIIPPADETPLAPFTRMIVECARLRRIYEVEFAVLVPEHAIQPLYDHVMEQCYIPEFHNDLKEYNANALFNYILHCDVYFIQSPWVKTMTPFPYTWKPRI